MSSSATLLHLMPVATAMKVSQTVIILKDMKNQFIEMFHIVAKYVGKITPEKIN